MFNTKMKSLDYHKTINYWSRGSLNDSWKGSKYVQKYQKIWARFSTLVLKMKLTFYMPNCKVRFLTTTLKKRRSSSSPCTQDSFSPEIDYVVIIARLYIIHFNVVLAIFGRYLVNCIFLGLLYQSSKMVFPW